MSVFDIPVHGICHLKMKNAWTRCLSLVQHFDASRLRGEIFLAFLWKHYLQPPGQRATYLELFYCDRRDISPFWVREQDVPSFYVVPSIYCPATNLWCRAALKGRVCMYRNTPHACKGGYPIAEERCNFVRKSINIEETSKQKCAVSQHNGFVCNGFFPMWVGKHAPMSLGIDSWRHLRWRLSGNQKVGAIYQ